MEISGQQPVTLPPVCLPYSPEFAPDQPGRGAAALAQIATTTGGKEREEIPKIWGDLPVKSRYVELAPWLLVFSTVLFLLEVLERRTGWVTRFFGRKPLVAHVETKEIEISEVRPATKQAFPWLVRRPARTQSAPAPVKIKTSATATVAPAKPLPEKPASTESTFDALRKACERAHRRTDKDMLLLSDLSDFQMSLLRTRIRA